MKNDRRYLFSKLLTMFLVAVLVVGTVPVYAAKKTSGSGTANIAEAQIGDEITFGLWEQDGNSKNGKEPIAWNVIGVDDDGCILVASKYILNVTRGIKTDISDWLMGEFYKDAFTADEKKIIEVKNNISDAVFLLSYEEALKYYAHANYRFDENRQIKPTKYAENRVGIVEKEIQEYLDSKTLVSQVSAGTIGDNERTFLEWYYPYVSEDNGDEYPWAGSMRWALRDEGYVCASGFVADDSLETEEWYGIRPALWIRQKSESEYKKTLTAIKKNEEKIAEESIKSLDKTLSKLKGEIGEKIYFGRYEQDGNPVNGAEPIEWEITDIIGGKALFVSTKLLDTKEYDGTNWKNSKLRKWLNSEFIETAFYGKERERIIESSLNTVPAYPSKKDGEYSSVSTKDKIFVLSYEEIRALNNDYWENTKCMIKATEYAFWSGLWISNPVEWEYGYNDENADCGCWYLRDGHCVTESGSLFLGYSDVYNERNYNFGHGQGVRPALWMEISDQKCKLSKTKLSLQEGDSERIELIGDVRPTWSSDNPDVVSINDDGTIYALQKGKATIKAVSRDGQTYKCSVTVNKRKSNNEQNDLLQYDSKGRLIKATYFDSYIVYEYDKKDNVKKETEYNLDGNIISENNKEYDASGNLIKENGWYESIWSGERYSNVITYTYYKDGSQKEKIKEQTNLEGRVTYTYLYEFMKDGTSKESYKYFDDEGNVTIFDNSEYDKDGRIVKSESDTGTILYKYNANGDIKTRIYKYVDWGNEEITEKTEYSYYKKGVIKKKIETVTDGSGEIKKKNEEKYNKKGAITSEVLKKKDGVYSEKKQEYILADVITKKTYKYNKNGNIKQTKTIEYYDDVTIRQIIELYNSDGELYCHKEKYGDNEGWNIYYLSKYDFGIVPDDY